MSKHNSPLLSLAIGIGLTLGISLPTVASPLNYAHRTSGIRTVSPPRSLNLTPRYHIPLPSSNSRYNRYHHDYHRSYHRSYNNCRDRRSRTYYRRNSILINHSINQSDSYPEQYIRIRRVR
ncbi:MAG: hypothetical protein QNJ32_27830 [Xenococcaceae cyanobacterium MO_167.B27]|nr:hypothetical protein [Xenococcaceae cyanobacterium MO_167.B27]